MDSERLEAFRDGILRTSEAFKRHDWPAAFGGLPDDFEWHPFAEALDEGVARGPDGVRAFFERLVEVYPDWWAEPREFLPAPGDKIVVLCVGRGIGRSSGVGAQVEFGQVWELDGSIPRRVREYSSHSDALKAAGLG